jgi:hypothetical protein
MLNYVFLISLVLAGLGIAFVSRYAFWLAISAYLLLASHRQHVIWRL